MSQDSVDAVRSSYEAFARGDFPAVLEAMDAGIEWVDQDSLPWGGIHTGHDEFATHMQSFGSYFEEFRIDPQEFWDCGDHVVVTGRFSGHGQAGEFDSAAAWVWRMRDGKATRVDSYTDTAAVLKAVGR
jgi:ketosteroid isomerase-like protein